MSDIEVTKNEARNRYEAVIDGEVVGFADYVIGVDTVTFPHTEVSPSFAGRGVASAIARASLEDVRAMSGKRVVPACSFYAEWLRKHPQDADLLDRTADPVKE